MAIASVLGLAPTAAAGITTLALLGLALLAFPFLGFGFATSLVALTALAIPPILINASTGLRRQRKMVLIL